MSLPNNRRLRVVLVLGAVIAAFGVSWTTLPTGADDGIPIDTDPFIECYSFVPHLPSTVRGDVITANIVIARDGVSESKARAIMAEAAKPYAPNGNHAQVTPRVKFNIVAVHDLTKELTGTDVAGFYTEDSPVGDDLMAQLIRYYRKTFPNLNRHHVHLITNRDLTSGELGNAVAGIDNCIGSIGTKDSYSIGESGTLEPFSFQGLVDFYGNIDAKIAAHEIGHAFGAHHHYANCVEFAAPGLLKGTSDVCSLMFNDAGLEHLRFSLLETLAIRGYAEAHIAGVPQLLPDIPVTLPPLP